MKQRNLLVYGLIVVLALGLAACDGNSGNDATHTHDFSGTWQKDATQHWKVCDYDGEKEQKAAHVLAADYKCGVCGYVHDHVFGGNWQKDATNHWKECADDEVKGEEATHEPAVGDCNECGFHNHDWKTTSETISEGVKAKKCNYCDEKKDYTFDYQIGSQGPGGGKIIYIADGLESRPIGFIVTGEESFTAYYLEAAPVNQATQKEGGDGFTWASPEAMTQYDGHIEYIDIKGTGEAIGTGKENTRLILVMDENAPAAKACANYSGGGKSDWFLPSIRELDEMYKARTNLDNLGTINDESYPHYSGFWSSSQSQSNNYHASWRQFYDGEMFLGGKDSLLNVRAVRAF